MRNRSLWQPARNRNRLGEKCEKGAARWSGFLIGPNFDPNFCPNFGPELWQGFGSGVLTRREQEMPRSFAVNNKCRPMTTGVVISLLLALLVGLTLSTTLQAQGPALTTISDTVYR